MENIAIKNFGPVANAAIEIKPLLVLIGQQASGKSTISKLIYFFKSLSDELFAQYYKSEATEICMDRDFVTPIRIKFHKFFGSTYQLRNFEICYTYPTGNSITLTLDAQRKLLVRMSDGFITPKKEFLRQAATLMSQVLRGKYALSEYGESLVFPGGSVYLRNSSSGQQEAIRILQDAFLSISQEKNLLRIIEEPEAHLFPEAQKHTIQMLVLALNCNPDNSLVITTHSPYTLTVLNNLIYASLIAGKYPESAEEVNEIIPKNLWIPSTNIAAYMLQDGCSENIIDKDLQMIQAERIDSVSTAINEEYELLLDVEYAHSNTGGDE